MLGLSHFNVKVVSIIIDRKLFWVHTINKTDPDWSQQLAAYLAKDNITGKQRVLLLDDVSFLNRLKTESVTNAAMFDSCIFLICDTPENLSSMSSLDIADSVRVGDAWKYIKLVPAKFNEIIAAAKPGLVISPADKLKSATEKSVKTDGKVEKTAAAKESTVVFEPGKDLFFQHVEDCLAPCAEEHQRQILRQLIAAWFEGGLSSDYGTRIVKRMEKYGGNVASYRELETQANDLGYADQLKLAARASASNEKSLKEIAQSYNVRIGDLKWLNNSWPFSNLVVTDDTSSQGNSKEM